MRPYNQGGFQHDGMLHTDVAATLVTHILQGNKSSYVVYYQQLALSLQNYSEEKNHSLKKSHTMMHLRDVAATLVTHILQGN